MKNSHEYLYMNQKRLILKKIQKIYKIKYNLNHYKKYNTKTNIS